MTRGKSSRVASVDLVRSRVERWMQTRQGKARIPDELWSAAVAVARRDGVNRTAAALHLDGGKLKQRMMASGTDPHKTTPPAFVELMASGGVRSRSGLPEYILELESHNGRLRIHCKGATAADLADLSRALWSLAA
jgi:hypothetical protein